jgi:hypothetical protein
MAHRGRLNVLTNIAGKTYGQIFREFEGTQDPRTVQGSGDVKYHLGTEGVFHGTDGTEIPVYLAANPSHLEAADGVLEDTVVTVGAEPAVWIDTAVEQWAASRGERAEVKLRARRIGAGVSSYAALRYNVVLEGATTAVDDDRIIELKEERDGIVLHGVPQRLSPEWSSPGARVVDAQRRLQTRDDADGLLGFAHLGGLSFRLWNILALARTAEGLFAENIYFDISAISVLAADSPLEDEFVWTIRNVGVEHVLFGSDYPQFSVAKNLDALNRLGLTPQEQAAIRYENARRLFRLK